MPIKKIHFFGALYFLTLITSCSVGPSYHKPDCYLPESWSAASELDALEPLDLFWWETFGDAQLNDYIQQAALNNRSVRSAVANICKAKAARAIAASAWYPNIDAELRENKNSFNTFFGGAGDPEPGNLATITTNTEQNLFFTGLDAIWEIDIFGRTRREVEAAVYRIGSSIESYHDVLITVFAETAKNYMDARGLQELIAIKERQIDLSGKAFELQSNKNETGLISDLALNEARVDLDRIKADLPLLYADMYASIYRLSVLTGQLPQALLDEMVQVKPFPELPEVVGCGIPSELLQRRPDIRHAERELAAATADIGVAIGNLFPRFFLAGSIGNQTFSTPLTVLKGFVWSYTVDILTPIFKGDRLMANIRGEKANAAKAYYGYEAAILQAVEETESHVLGYAQELKRKASLEHAFSDKSESVSMTRGLFDSGISDAISLLEMERQYLEVEEVFVRSKISAVERLISLYKALGGGWDNSGSSKD